MRRGSKLAANVEASVKLEAERGQRATGTEDREPGKGSRRYTEQLCFLYLLWGMRVGLKGAPGAGGFVEIFWQSRGWILILHGPDPAPTAMWERESFGCRSSASGRAL